MKTTFVEIGQYAERKAGDLIKFIKRDENGCVPIGSPFTRFDSSRDRITWDQVVHTTSEYTDEKLVTRHFCLNSVVNSKDVILVLRETENDEAK